jgi:hypothetical protein
MTKGAVSPSVRSSRFIPVPTSVSEQAQRSLAWTCSVAVLDRVVPRDAVGWRALIKETDELLVAVMGAQVEHLRSSVRIQIGR